jgi:hypothetical protein
MGIPPISKQEKTMTSIGSRIVQQIRRDMPEDRRMPEQEPSELERAFRNYKDMEAERDRLRFDMNELRVRENSLLAEVNMLREALERSDNDRIRLQAVASSLAGGLKAINAVIGDQMASAIKNGVVAVEQARPEEKAELDEAGAQAQEIIQRTEPVAPAQTVATVPRNQF